MESSIIGIFQYRLFDLLSDRNNPSKDGSNRHSMGIGTHIFYLCFLSFQKKRPSPVRVSYSLVCFAGECEPVDFLPPFDHL